MPRFYIQNFAEYTMSNCWMECLMNLSQAVNADRCIPWNFPSIDDVTCKPRNSHKFMENFRFLDMSKVKKRLFRRCVAPSLVRSRWHWKI